MAERIEKTTVREVNDSSVDGTETQDLLTNLIWFISGVILVVLAFRFVFALLGANPANGFADFVYDISYPLVAPFFGLFSYDYQYGISKFETYTLVAMMVYSVIAWGLTALINLNRR